MRAVLDGVLDRSLLGYTAVGYRARSTFGWPADPAPDALAGRVAVVTGGGAGLGKAAAAGLLALGARVHLVVRNVPAASVARAELLAVAPDADVQIDECDVSSLGAVREYADGFTGPIDVLIHNAGVMPAHRTVSVDGHELCLATHVLGPHLLTAMLTPALRGSVRARVIWVTSGGMYAQRLDVEDVEYEGEQYRPTAAYARTKRMQVVLASQWARRLAADGIVVHSMHPGWADTPGVSSALPTFRRITARVLRTPRQGADTMVWLSAADEAGRTTGALWLDRVRRPEHYVPWTRETAAEAERLMAMCDAATGADGSPDASNGAA